MTTLMRLLLTTSLEVGHWSADRQQPITVLKMRPAPPFPPIHLTPSRSFKAFNNSNLL